MFNNVDLLTIKWHLPNTGTSLPLVVRFFEENAAVIHEWKKFGLELGLPYQLLERIEVAAQKHTCLSNLLARWLQTKQLSRRLIEALQSLSFSEEAAHIENYLAQPSKYGGLYILLPHVHVRQCQLLSFGNSLVHYSNSFVLTPTALPVGTS